MNTPSLFRHNVRKRLFTVTLLAALNCLLLSVRAAEADVAVRGLIERIAPGHAGDFDLETIAALPGENVFEVEAHAGKIVLRGDTPLSQAVALHWYLKHDAFADVSWYADDVVNLPEKLPLPSGKVRRTTRLKDRFFLNYCTFGYTLPYWRWRDWERFIDWMALNGINLPLAQTGNEFIWQKVWREYGLSDEEIRSYFTGSAYLPWHRMLNIDEWGGPLPQGYIDGQHDLQKKILARERELDMRPVLCAFAGHVPEALKVRQPAMKIENIPAGWGTFPKKYACWFLNPLDPKFKEIQAAFLREQQKEYGTSHYYGADPFNEITPPSWEPSYLAGVSRAIYEGMAQVDPDAVWLQMGWTFANDRRHWNDERISAMIRAVPQGRMVLIDYVCEERELFRETKAFLGAPFLWAYLGNFGGNTYLVGPINKINQRLTSAMNDLALTNFTGVAGTLEGFNNPVVYELLFDRIWAGTNLDLAAWVRDEARARAGGGDAKVELAWDVLREKILLDNAVTIHGHGIIHQASRPSLRDARNTQFPYLNKDLARVWGLLLQASPAARKSSGYQRDLVDITRQCLGNHGLVLRDQMAAAYDRKDPAGFKQVADQFMTLGNDLDQYLGVRSEFMLGKWIDDAKSWAANQNEQRYYEQDARRIITVWGGSFTDYASRQWNGLMRDYYLPRWRIFIDAMLAELNGGPRAKLAALNQAWRKHDSQFVTTVNGEYATTPRDDYFASSRALYDKYAPQMFAGIGTPPGSKMPKAANAAVSLGAPLHAADKSAEAASAEISDPQFHQYEDTAQSGSQTINFDAGWRFLQKDAPGAESADYDDSTWRQVDVPHDWSVDNCYSPTNHPQNSWLPGGVGWYRKAFDLPASWAGKSVIARFDGVYMNSAIWLNGQRVGGRPYGFMTFECDLTPHLRPGRNVLAVRADNTPEPTLRFYHGSGIYAHVRLFVLPKLHIRRLGGIFIRTQSATDEEARLLVSTETSDPTETNIVHRLLDAAGNPVATAHSGQTLVVARPQLWSVESPYLYTLETTLVREGRVADCVLTPFGIRTMRFDAATGFWLNGRNVKLNGVCEHIELMPVGLGVTDKLIEWRLRTLKAMGCNAIRAGHSVFPPAFFDACDRLGMLVMDEFCDGWHRKGANDYGGRFFKEWWKQDVRDWVQRDRNHPCVILWSIGNETGTKDINDITGWVHQFDDHTRPTTGGMVTEGVDVAGFNGPGGQPGVLEQFHAKHPEKPIVITEEPHTVQTRGFYRVVTWWRDKGAPRYDFPPYGTTEIFTGGDPTYKSSYDNAGVRMSCRTSLVRTKSTPWIAGEFRWTGFECFGEAQFMGARYPRRTYNCGILDLAGFPKDSYYLYQSQWTAAPMVHLLPHWTHPDLKPGTVIPVVAYSNGEEVELFLNGKSLGRQRPRELLDFVWNVPYAPGTLKAVAFRQGQPVATTQHVTAGNPVRLCMETNAFEMVTVSALDSAGNPVPWAHDDVAFAVTGSARVLGFENGDPLDDTPAFAPHRRLFAGLARGYFQASSPGAPIEIAAAAILANRRLVAMDCQRIALQGSLPPASIAIHYTVDSTAPTATSSRYEKPFTLDHAATIKALVLRDGKEWMKLETALKEQTAPALVSQSEQNPLDKELVGRWREGRQIFTFEANGTLKLGGTPVGQWWYDYPDDLFEAGKDAGQGELRWARDGQISELKLTDQKARELLIITARKSRRLTKAE